MSILMRRSVAFSPNSLPPGRTVSALDVTGALLDRLTHHVRSVKMNDGATASSWANTNVARNSPAESHSTLLAAERLSEVGLYEVGFRSSNATSGLRSYCERFRTPW